MLIEQERKQGMAQASNLQDQIFEMSLAAGGIFPEQETDQTEPIPTDDLRSAAVAIWQRSLEKIKGQISPQSYTTWFEPLVPKSLEGTTLTLLAPSGFISEWILQHYQQLIESALIELLGPQAGFAFEHAAEVEGVETLLEPAAYIQQVPTPQAVPAPQAAAAEIQPPVNRINVSAAQVRENRSGVRGMALAPKPPVDPNINPGYEFDTFIRGEANKLAFAASMAVANNPGGTRYNPLVIYGNVGLGKTHLIQAIGNYSLNKFPELRVLYTSSERFTKEFVDAVQSDRINDFNNLYRSIDMLIIDDVQFFAGKERTQDSFFHTFNELRENGKQIILTCDRPPKELKDIDDRLLNRLQWGLTADIGAPDLEMRIAILRHKAIRDGFDISDEVLEFIASNVTTNIRELEGCLISLEATISLEGKEPSVELAREVLRKVARRSAPVLSVETIQKYTAKFFSIEEQLLRDKTRKQEVVQARQVAMYLCKELTASTLNTIGLHFGGRDHSTVIHAQQTIIDDMRHDPTFAHRVNELKRQLELMQ
ncbi:MAG: chromosomal replication initiator protein DnaA [Bacteroidota bacterium]|nr:chromosomal replication initiator protein DnaA [Bacteroidota bacterium]MDP4229598.1 chromosomal replication initiator protein DnaA [Bacteroidota bacterium]